MMGYEIYGLRENPFPKGGAILKPESTDPRENGSIFSVNARSEVRREFEEKFAGVKTAFEDRARCGFLWAEGDRITGRGMGKTALAVYLKHKMNEGYGRQYFNGDAKFFCSYVSFKEQLKAKIAFLYKEFFRSFIADGIFAHISDCVDKADLVRAGVAEDFADAVAGKQVKEYLESISRYRLDQMSTAWDQKFLVKLPDLFLNQTVRCLEAAGFEGGIIVIDDIENLTDKSTRREIESFIKDFGLAFFRAGNEASNTSFFTVILTTHQQSAQKISEAWVVAGLASSYPMHPSGRTSLLVPKPDREQSMDIVKEYIRHFREPSFMPSYETFPFAPEAIELIIEESDYHPRRILSRCRAVLTEALSRGEEEITKEFVKTIPEIEEETRLPGIEEF